MFAVVRSHSVDVLLIPPPPSGPLQHGLVGRRRAQARRVLPRHAPRRHGACRCVCVCVCVCSRIYGRDAPRRRGALLFMMPCAHIVMEHIHGHDAPTSRCRSVRARAAERGWRGGMPHLLLSTWRDVCALKSRSATFPQSLPLSYFDFPCPLHCDVTSIRRSATCTEGGVA